MQERRADGHQPAPLHKREYRLQVPRRRRRLYPPARILLEQVQLRPPKRVLLHLLLHVRGEILRRLRVVRGCLPMQDVVARVIHELAGGGGALVADTREIVPQRDVSVAAIARLAIVLMLVWVAGHEILLLMLQEHLLRP